MITQQVVIDSTTKEVKRYGRCDFENDGSFDPETEELIGSDFLFEPPMPPGLGPPTEVWYYNGSTFQITPP